MPSDDTLVLLTRKRARLSPRVGDVDLHYRHNITDKCYNRGPSGFVCTLPKGHGGRHVCHQQDGLVVGVHT